MSGLEWVVREREWLDGILRVCVCVVVEGVGLWGVCGGGVRGGELGLGELGWGVCAQAAFHMGPSWS